MKHYFSMLTYQRISFIFFVFFFMIFLMFPIATAAGGESNAEDKVISLSANAEPLGEVLNKISMASGYKFILDKEWENSRVTVALENVTVNQALNQILRDLNHVIIYGTDQKVKIVIYGKAAHESATPIPSMGESSVEKPVPGLPPAEAVEQEESPDTEGMPPNADVVTDREAKSRAVINKQKKRQKIDDSDKE
jgi:type II secretory pathway component GspD/PulD (secretin)